MEKHKDPRILYIEDDPALARLLEKTLIRANYRVKVASSGAQGLSMQSENSYDVIAVDLELPDMTGLEVIRRMAERGDLPPTIIITGAGSEGTAVAALKLGARDYIIKDIEGAYLEVLPSVVDRVLQEKRLIEEKERTQQALAESEKKYRTLVDNSLVGIYTTALDGRILYANKALANMFGYGSVKECMTLSSTDLWKAPGQRKIFLKKLLEERQINGYELEVLDKSGRTLTVLLSATLEGEILSGMILDITRRKEMEQALMNARNLESLGTIAGGIAHDFNNLLTPILGNISLLRESLDKADDRYRLLQEIENSSLHAKNLVGRLLTFSKGGAPLKRKASIGRLLEETASHVLQGFDVKTTFTMAPDLWLTAIDYGQMGYALHNVILNAREAVKNNGIIQFKAENVCVSEGETLPLPPGNYVRVSVMDNGSGIPAENISRIFDPYYSTKEMGADKGTGLGLAITFSVIKKHNGHLSVDSETGEGTTVHMYVPASPPDREEPAVEETAVVSTATVPARPGAARNRVLIMDDEEVVLSVAVRMLEYMNCRVESAVCGEEAIKLYRQAMKEGEPFKMVILDLSVQGGMGGRETIEELRKIDPGVTAVVSSGYSTDPIILDYEKYGFKAALPKPYRMAEMRRTLEIVPGLAIK